MSRKKIVAGNWKMNLDIDEASEWLADVEQVAESYSCDILVFPSLIMIGDMMDLYEGEKIVFGAQNCSHVEKGAFTGEVSAAQLASVGVEFVIVGHSERRQYFSETDIMVARKIKQVLKHKMTPIVCFGEPLETRNEGGQLAYIKAQLEATLYAFSEVEISNIIIAYEPIWAIGTGLNASAEQAQEMHAFIRSQIATKYSEQVASELPIIYGGSCKPENAVELFACTDVDGALVGGSSLIPGDFLAIIEAASKA